MNDPHVVSLTYKIQHSKSVNFDEASSLPTVDRGVFKVTIDRYQAKVEMTDHFASVDEARTAAEPYLRAWEFQTDLAQWDERFRFVFDRADVIDQTPRKGKPAQASVVFTAVAGDTVEAHVSRSRWPDPPQDLKLSPDAETMWCRWLIQREKREPLLSAAYWSLTMLEAAPQLAASRSTTATTAAKRSKSSRKRREAATFFNIDQDVLNKLGELTSTRGGAESRKAEGQFAPLSPAERRWVEAAFRELVRRVAQQAHCRAPPRQKLVMADLPPLP